jgi:hypothetical protein
MSETTSPVAPAADPANNSPIVHFGGMLGVAACFVGLSIFLGGCMGFERSFDLACIPLAMSAVGLVMTVIGGMQRRVGVEHTPVLAGLLLNVFGLVGGIIEWAFAHGSTIFPITK